MHKRMSPHGDYDHMGEAINLVNNFRYYTYNILCRIRIWYCVYIDWRLIFISFLFS